MNAIADTIDARLEQLLSTPDEVDGIDDELVGPLLACLATRQAALIWLQSALTARLLAALQPTAAGPDRLLDVDETANRLGVSTDWLYHHAKQLPFTVRIGRQLRFSADGITRYIEQRRGTTARSAPFIQKGASR